MDAQPALSLRGLRGGYRDQVILDGVDLDIAPGQFTVLCGPNGSGKSTLLMTMARVLAPLGGSLLLEGRPLARIPPREMARARAILPQNPPLPEGLTVFELVARGRYPHQGRFGLWRPADLAAVEQALQRTGMETLSAQPLAALSGGQRQRAWIAMALAQDSRIILLDEPISALDLRYQTEIMELLQTLARGGKTVVAVVHDLNLALAHSDRMALLHQGRLHASGPTPKICTPENIRACFGQTMLLLPHPQGGRPVLVPDRS